MNWNIHRSECSLKGIFTEENIRRKKEKLVNRFCSRNRLQRIFCYSNSQVQSVKVVVDNANDFSAEMKGEC